MSRSKPLAEGTEVEFTAEGKILRSCEGPDGGWIYYMQVETPHGPYTMRLAAGAGTLVALVPAHVPTAPGQLWETLDGRYMARISRRDLPLRFTPADLSNESGLKTLDEDTFFITYPDARIICGAPQRYRDDGEMTIMSNKVSRPDGIIKSNGILTREAI